jgi:hypothetical protein
VTVGTDPYLLGTHHGSPGTEITSGGHGSPNGCCCGITLGVHNDTGYVYAATEDWTGPQGYHTYLCDDNPHNHDCRPPSCGPCTQARQPVAWANPSSGVPWDVNISWEVRTDGHTRFQVVDPKDTHGNVILPGNNRGGHCSASDPTRIRADDSNNTSFGPHDGLRVYSVT